MQNLWESLPVSVARVLPIQFTIPLGLGFFAPSVSVAPTAPVSRAFKAADVPREGSPAARGNWLGFPAGTYEIRYLKDGTTGSKADYAVTATGILNADLKAKGGVVEQNFAQFAQDLQAGFASGSIDAFEIVPAGAAPAGGVPAGAVPAGAGLSPAASDTVRQFEALEKWRSTPAGIVAGLLSTAGMGVLTYHGYKRNNGSIGWALCWGLLGGIIWPVTVPIAFAQGLGKPKAPKQNPEPPARSVQRPVQPMQRPVQPMQRRVRLVPPASSAPEAQARIADARQKTQAAQAEIEARRKCRNCGALAGKGCNCCECGTCNCC